MGSSYKSNFDEQITKFIEEIYMNTKEYLSNSGNFSTKASEISSQLVGYIKDFFTIMSYNNYDLERAIKSLGDIKLIKVTNTVSKVASFEGAVLINQDFFLKSKNYSDNEIRYLLFYALTKQILSFRTEDTLNFSKTFSSILGENRYMIEVLVNYGWLLLEECIALEISKRFIKMFDENARFVEQSSDDFELITLTFGMTLSNIANKENHSASFIMYNLMKKAMNQDFSKTVISEYIENGSQIELFEILYLMGLILNEHNKRFPYIILSEKDYRDSFKQLHLLITSLVNLESSIINQQTSSENTNPISASKKFNPFEAKRILSFFYDKKI